MRADKTVVVSTPLLIPVIPFGTETITCWLDSLAVVVSMY